MPLDPNFSSSESISTPSQITLVDTSTGSDTSLTNRLIILRLADGTYLGPDGIVTTQPQIFWPIADNSITLDILPTSLTINITVVWLAGFSSAYTKTILTCFDLFDYVFGFGLIQSQTATPSIIQDVNYYSNFFLFITNIWCSESSVTYGNDIYSSQSTLNVNQNMITNSNDYF